MYYILLLILLFLFLIISYFIFDREVLCPPTLLLVIYFLCAIVGIFRYSEWNFDSYSGISVLLVLSGLGSFLLFGAIAYFNSCRIAKKSYKYRQLERIDLKYSTYFMLILIGVVSIVLFFIHIKTIISHYGIRSSGFSQFVFTYYLIKTYHTDVGITGITKFFSILSNVNALICVYIFINNLVIKVLRAKDYLCILIVLLWIIHSLLDSSRGEIMLIMAEIIYVLYFLWNVKYKWSQKVNYKIITWGGRAFVAIIIGFLFLAVILGRRDSVLDIDIKSYLTTYMSAGVRNFDIFVQSRTESSIFGKETFYSINRFLYNRFGIGEMYSNALEFAIINGEKNGNIYSALRRFYADFGFFGLIILPGLLGYGFTKSFKKIKNASLSGNLGFRLVLFSSLCAELFFFPIEERFFTVDFSINGFFRIFLLYFVYLLLIRKRFIVKIW